ncbi:hypothetical protein BDZ85DRAFT_263295 [Elsinoe ampelina]|uniref:Uncharacterized protein n=1 Tax=Elsinoe ampelina TaxID=302913 RepID=A0A6A6GA28_9PEZI|nr:hypothetical protein BDZ85DRAFT_263295 [Elsinoe ampelina]
MTRIYISRLHIPFSLTVIALIVAGAQPQLDEIGDNRTFDYFDAYDTAQVFWQASSTTLSLPVLAVKSNGSHLGCILKPET